MRLPTADPIPAWRVPSERYTNEFNRPTLETRERSADGAFVALKDRFGIKVRHPVRPRLVKALEGAVCDDEALSC